MTMLCVCKCRTGRKMKQLRVGSGRSILRYHMIAPGSATSPITTGAVRTTDNSSSPTHNGMTPAAKMKCRSYTHRRCVVNEE